MLIPPSSCGHAGPWEEKTCHGYLCFFISQMLYKILTFDIEKRKTTLRSTNFHMFFFFRNSNNGVVSPRNLPTLSQDASCCSLSKGLKRRPGYRTAAASRGNPRKWKVFGRRKNLTTWDVHPLLPVRKSSKRTEPNLSWWRKKMTIFQGWCGFTGFLLLKKTSFYS